NPRAKAIAATPAPGERFAAEENSRGNEPHPHPGRHAVQDYEAHCWKSHERKPIHQPAAVPIRFGIQQQTFQRTFDTYICNFSIHRNRLLKTTPPLVPPIHTSLRILSTNFTNFISPLVRHERTCAYHAVVVSKKPARSRSRSSVCLSVPLSLPASAM